MKGAFYTLYNSQLEVKPKTRFKLGLVTDWKSDMTKKLVLPANTLQSLELNLWHAANYSHG